MFYNQGTRTHSVIEEISEIFFNYSFFFSLLFKWILSRLHNNYVFFYYHYFINSFPVQEKLKAEQD